MRIAHLILAHKNFEQLRRLVDMLRAPDVYCFIHLDKKIDINMVSSLFDSERQDVIFIRKRVSCKWGNYSLIQATVNGISEILAHSEFDYINFISGKDLPLTSAHDFKSFLENNYGSEFINVPIYDPTDPWWIKNECRFFEYNFHNWKIPGKYKLQFLVNRIVPKRKFPKGIRIAGNSQWFCITSSLAKYMINYIDTNPRFVRYFKYVWGADEFIFATIAIHSQFRNNIRPYLHYIDWSESTDAHPKKLGRNDLDKAFASGKYFARKFDMTKNPDILDLIANRLGTDSAL